MVLHFYHSLTKIWISSKLCQSLTLHFQTIALYIMLYVDDIVLTGTDDDTLQHLIENLKTEFQLRNLGHISHFLGIKIQRTNQGLFLNQSPYLADILQHASMYKCKPVSTPIALLRSAFKTEDSSTNFSSHLYHVLVGSLQYLTLTRPDIAFAVKKLFQSMHLPQPPHLQSLKRLLRYLNGIISRGISSLSRPLQLLTFSDVDWAKDSIDCIQPPIFVHSLRIPWSLGKLPNRRPLLILLRRWNTEL